MRLVTRFECAKKSDNELRSLLRQLFNAVAASTQSSQDRHHTLASIQNIQNELISRTLSI